MRSQHKEAEYQKKFNILEKLKLCSMLGDWGIKISVKGDFQRIFGRGWAETKLVSAHPQKPGKCEQNSIVYRIQFGLFLTSLNQYE